MPIGELMAEFHDGPHATPKPSAEGPVFLGIKNLTDAGNLDLSAVRHIAPEDFTRWTTRVTPQQDDIVFTHEATLHRYALIPRGFHGCLGRRLALIRPHRDRADPRYLHQALRSPAWRSTVEERVISGATVDRIPLIDFPSFPIRVPNLGTQRRIAAVLAAFDELIAINERRIELLEDLARSLYREWFVRLRFPGHNSKIDGLPDAWQHRPASQVFTVNPRIRSDQAAFPKVTMRDVDERFATVFPSEVVARASGSRFQRDDVLFARITPCLENGKTALAKFLDRGVMGVGSTEFIVLRGVTVGPAFTYCAARSDAVRQHAIKSMSGASGRQRVASNAFDALELVEPSAEVAAAFERCVGPLLDEGFALASQDRALARTRDLLLPRLVTGRLDISDIDLGDLLPAELAA